MTTLESIDDIQHLRYSDLQALAAKHGLDWSEYCDIGHLERCTDVSDPNFVIVLKQRDEEGCGYTIGCGYLSIPVRVVSLEALALIVAWATSGSDLEYAYVAEKPVSMPVDEWAAERIEAEDAAEEAVRIDQKRKLLAQLKAELGED